MFLTPEEDLNPRPFFPDVPDYWPDVSGDLTKVIWSHATNSQQKLEEAIIGNGDSN